MSVNAFSTKVLIHWGHYFYVSLRRQDCHFTWSSEPCEGLAVAGQRKFVLSSFLSYFKTLSIGPVPEIEPMTSQSAVKRSNNWTNPVVVRSEEKQNVTKKNWFIIFTLPIIHWPSSPPKILQKVNGCLVTQDY